MKNKTKLQLLLACVGLLLSTVAIMNYISITEAQSRWSNFQNNIEKRQTYSTELVAQLGYLGMIHNFKDYILQGDEKSLTNIEQSFIHLDEIIENFRNLPDISNEEQQATSILINVIDQYKQALSLAKQLKAQGASPSVIQRQTKVDDSSSEVALDTITRGSQASNQKAINAVEHQLKNVSMIGTIGPIISLIIIFIGTLKIAFQPLGGIERLGGLMTKAGKSKDLTLRAPVKDDSELSQLSLAFNTLMTPFYEMVCTVSHSSADVDIQTSNQVDLVENMVSSVRHQQDEINNVATAMNQMSATVSEVASNASSAAQAAEHANEQANNGSRVMESTVLTIGQLSQRVELAGTAVSQLEQESGKIGNVLEVITGIAEQTNLLALNAAIEAARAGEYGRGFAVVADEVRALASRTKGSAEEIRNMLNGFQKQVGEVAQLMVEGEQHAQKGSLQATESGEVLQTILKSISEINDMSIQIATASEEQTQVANEITQSVTAISDEADKTVTNAEDTLQAISVISDKVSELNQAASLFNIEGPIRIDK